MATSFAQNTCLPVSSMLFRPSLIKTGIRSRLNLSSILQMQSSAQKKACCCMHLRGAKITGQRPQNTWESHGPHCMRSWKNTVYTVKSLNLDPSYEAEAQPDVDRASNGAGGG